MARINLLPWRAEIRKQQQKDFIAAILLGVSLTMSLMVLVHFDISAKQEYQNERNRFLEAEIAALDKKIKEIDDLEGKRKRMLARMEVIQQLQASRPEIVHLFDDLGRTIPEGVYLSDLVQNDKSITVNGIAQSNARVSAYMRNLESSVWLKSPLLNIIQTQTQIDNKDSRKERQNKFTLQVKQASAEKPEAKPVTKKKVAP
jgi:type IV pilus assembly protein PilN